MNNKILPIFLLLLILLPSAAFGQAVVNDTSGYILLQVQEKGEAWYVYPSNNNRYYLGRPDDAFNIMKRLALGVKHDYLANTTIFPERLSGLILLDVENNGEAYYIYPATKRKYYLGRPADAFRIMNNLGLGITNRNLSNIPVGDINKTFVLIPDISRTTKFLQIVPFTSQAPYGDWADLRQEDGCEESSALMAVKWARNESLTRDIALKEILGASDYIQDKYKEFRDISTTDTLNWILKDYFNYHNVAIKKDISLTELIQELTKGNLIIAPMNGRALHNPYFTQPGPINHMLVIRGYDKTKDVFITNDPGTRHGEAYEYNTNVLYQAIRAYPTGSHEPNDTVMKDVIVVWK